MEFVDAEKLRQVLTHVCCISFTDQVLPLCSVNVFTGTEIPSQQRQDIDPERRIPMPYIKLFSLGRNGWSNMDIPKA